MTTWLITGCSSGLGYQLAKAVLERGYNAVLTARNIAKLQSLIDQFPNTALALVLDVTKDKQITEVVHQAQQRFGRLDVLVNNAGYGYRAAIEEGDVADVSRLFATNFFGPVALIKAVLPGMRARRSGTILNLSSIAARCTSAGSGYYAATKCALEGMSQGLIKEVKPLGIKVMIVEPGAFRTDFAGRSLTQTSTIIDDYKQTAGLRRKEHNSSENGYQPGDPAKAAQVIIDAAEASDSPFKLLLGDDALAMASSQLEEEQSEITTWQAISSATNFS